MIKTQIEKDAELARTKNWLVGRFGIQASDIIDYHGGCCYDKIWVTNMDAAKKVAKAVKGDTVNGGMFHDMPLGAIEKQGDNVFEVMV
jgi:hypothetical protein